MSRTQILRPVNPIFMWGTIIVALVLNLQPWGRLYGIPDFVALALVFWNIHQPRRVGIGAAFVMGLLMDVNNANLLGEHALAYTLLSYLAITIHRRVLWFSIPIQSAHIFVLLLMAQAIQYFMQFIVTGNTLHPLFFAESLIGAVLWPVVTWLLLAPQRRPTDKDDTRPI